MCGQKQCYSTSAWCWQTPTGAKQHDKRRERENKKGERTKSYVWRDGRWMHGGWALITFPYVGFVWFPLTRSCFKWVSGWRLLWVKDKMRKEETLTKDYAHINGWGHLELSKALKVIERKYYHLSALEKIYMAFLHIVAWQCYYCLKHTCLWTISINSSCCCIYIILLQLRAILWMWLYIFRNWAPEANVKVEYL